MAALTWRNRAIGYVVNDNGCHVCTSHHCNKSGYAIIRTGHRRFLVHRFVYEMKHGRIPEGQVVRHTCDNPACINPDHLVLGTHQDNVRDRVERGRSAAGTNNGRAKLDWTKVAEIRASSEPRTSLARKYGVNWKVISDVQNHRTWQAAK